MNRRSALLIHWARIVGTACILSLLGTMPASAQTADSAMARIKAHDAVVIGYRQSSIPFSYLDENQKPTGRGGLTRSDSFLRFLSGTSEAIMLPI
ncbi:hypothetical protein [Burkholderia cepacia]|uniref:hypothetical protein n=1 Tax=Burkholderia cepacia TaxID=292 RepID=UPI00298FD567|nr:hypothetical protein [Burkholderia cepacia]